MKSKNNQFENPKFIDPKVVQHPVMQTWPKPFMDKPSSPISTLSDAKRFHNHFGKDWCYMVGYGWHEWQGERWKPDPLNAVACASRLGGVVKEEASTIEQAIKKHGLTLEAAAKHPDHSPKAKAALSLYKHIIGCESKTGIDNTLSVARSFLAVESADSDPFLLPCKNGVIDLKSGNIEPHKRENFNTICLAVEYDQSATAPVWERFIADTFGNDKSLIEYIQRFLGYCLTGSVEEHVAAIGYGTGRNGKSTLLEALKYILGEYARPAPSGLLTSSNKEKHPTEIAFLNGARFVSASETGRGKVFDEERLKWLTGGDTLTARLMRGDFFNFEPTHKFFMVTNHKPIVKGTDFGVWRRIHLIPFEHTAKNPDPELPIKLRAEAKGILNWLIEGAIKWRKDGLNPPEKILAATKEYQDDMDTIGQFISESSLANGKRISPKELHKEYLSWAEETGEWEATPQQLKTAMEERGYRQKKSGSIRFWTKEQ